MFAISIQALVGTRTGIQSLWQKTSVCLALFFYQMPAAFAEDLRAYTEEWPPYNYMAGDELKGISTDILRATCERVKINCAIQMVPWLRAYKTVGETPNTLIYTIARTPQREKEFIWIGPILPRTTWIYGKAGIEASIHNIKDLSSARIGVIRGEASLDELLAVGVPESSILVLNSNTDVMRMVKLGKVNVLVNTEIGMAINLKNFDVPTEMFSKLIKLSDGGNLYFAMNLQSDPALVIQLQTSVDKLKREGKIEAIVRSYTKAIN